MMGSGAPSLTSGGCASTNPMLGTQWFYTPISFSWMSSSPSLPTSSSPAPPPTMPMIWWSSSLSPLLLASSNSTSSPSSAITAFVASSFSTSWLRRVSRCKRATWTSSNTPFTCFISL
ncbi:hypothetical protein BHE74_00033178 [Ensete ventricosum]|nr:hypothetical protein BHE74_00033178 [Ensete ventricosum]